mmetsp:Transcript_17124/g.46356  ORF Transcript_17124/g.46356 Transcript_17124/m.46356 type:complete len:235 (-) Transcript_17124:610-1314(-)
MSMNRDRRNSYVSGVGDRRVHNDNHDAMRSTTTADAPPPPLQMLATPKRPSTWSSAERSVTRILMPDAPIGCPMATAPPNMFTLAGSSPRMRLLATDTTEKASLISKASTSAMVSPARSSATGIANAGDVVNLMGSCAASAYATMRALGDRPFACTSAPEVSTTAAAPSESVLELPAVTVPSRLKAGRAEVSRWASLKTSSSVSTVWSPLRPGMMTGATSPAKRPASVAASALA